MHGMVQWTLEPRLFDLRTFSGRSALVVLVFRLVRVRSS